MKRLLMVGLLAGWAVMVAGCKGTVQPAQSVTTNQTAASDAGGFTQRSESGSRARRPRAESGGTPGVFDFYLLTLSWSPEYCVSHPTDVQCAAKPAFVLHGLWPENTDGTYPEDCSSAAGPANPGQYSDIYPDQSLLEHEWTTHGTCSGLAADAYFQLERKAFHSVSAPPQLAKLKSVISLTPNQIITDFTQTNASVAAGDVAIACGNNRLTAIEVCLTKSLTVESCSGVKTCGATTVKITPPGATSDQ
jgi:ribonuclease T2